MIAYRIGGDTADWQAVDGAIEVRSLTLPGDGAALHIKWREAEVILTAQILLSFIDGLERGEKIDTTVRSDN